MNTETDTSVVYTHRTEYQEKDRHGKWSDVVTRDLNTTASLKQARTRHMQCHPVEYPLNGRDGVYAYRYGTCTLTRITTKTIRMEDAIA